MTQYGRNMATAIFCLVVLVPGFAANDTARTPMSGTRTAIRLVTQAYRIEACRTLEKHAHLPSLGRRPGKDSASVLSLAEFREQWCGRDDTGELARGAYEVRRRDVVRGDCSALAAGAIKTRTNALGRSIAGSLLSIGYSLSTERYIASRQYLM
jgi:hypothetical protein